MFMGFLSLGICLGMVKLIPMIETINNTGSLNHIKLALHADAYSKETIYAYTVRCFFNELFGVFAGYLNLGRIVFVTFLFSIIFCMKKLRIWLMCFVLFSIFLLAYNFPLDLFKYLWQLPFFNAIDQPQKYFVCPLIFIIAICAGQSFSIFEKIKNIFLRNSFFVIIIVCSVYPLFPRIWSIYKETHTYRLPVAQVIYNKEFYNIKSIGLVRDRTFPLNANSYVNILRNVGTIDWYTQMPNSEKAVPKYFIDKNGTEYFNNKYKGEIYFLNNKNKANIIFKPNKMTMQVVVREPSVLIVNQNYSKYWKTDKGSVFSFNGLIALKLYDTGDYTVNLFYRPTSFYIGLAISIASLFFYLMIFFKKVK